MSTSGRVVMNTPSHEGNSSSASMGITSRVPSSGALKSHRAHRLLAFVIAHHHRVALRIFTRHDRSSALCAIEKTCAFSRMSAKKSRSTGETPSTLGQTSSLLGLQAFASGSQDPHPACLPPRLASPRLMVRSKPF